MKKPERTGDLAAAIDASDARAQAAVAAAVLVLGAIVIVIVTTHQLRRAHKAERAEWAFLCQQMETERDVARARFTAEPGGEVTDAEA
jgi:uncharacterized membrane protein YoaK (UPF0700 family)